MEFHPGRVFGLVVGLAILVTLYFVPFSGGSSLSNIAGVLLSNTGSINSGSSQVIASNYITIVAFGLLFIAGVVGIFPLGSGILGAVAMALLTLSPYVIYPSVAQPAYGTAFYALWFESIVALAASFWHHR